MPKCGYVFGITERLFVYVITPRLSVKVTTEMKYLPSFLALTNVRKSVKYASSLSKSVAATPDSLIWHRWISCVKSIPCNFEGPKRLWLWNCLWKVDSVQEIAKKHKITVWGISMATDDRFNRFCIHQTHWAMRSNCLTIKFTHVTFTVSANELYLHNAPICWHGHFTFDQRCTSRCTTPKKQAHQAGFEPATLVLQPRKCYQLR